MKSKERISKTGEVFTPHKLVDEMLDKLPSDAWEPGKTVLDNSCGCGQFLSQAFIRKLEHSDNPLSDIFGVDLMADNVADTVARLACLLHLGIDIVDGTTATFLINHPAYADNHDHEWLQANHKDFERRYHGTLDGIDIDIDVTITFEYFDDGDAGVFRYTFIDGATEVNPNVVCHDALTYNYSFSHKRKKILIF